MSTELTTSQIFQAVLERIPIGDAFEYSNIEAIITRIDEKEIDIWIGNKAMKVPGKVQRMADTAEELGWKVTWTFKYEHPELFEEKKKEVKQVGLRQWFG